VNGIAYKDDPKILAWQHGNELGGWDGPSPPADWTLELSALMKSFTPNTLVMDGTQGGLDIPTRFPVVVLESPLVDIGVTLISKEYLGTLHLSVATTKRLLLVNLVSVHSRMISFNLLLITNL
jgi:hypothetical protein